jgi:hypothetical protein
MKTFLLSATAMMFALSTQAQQKVFTLGVEGGISVASLHYDNKNINDLYNSRTGYAAGIALQYNFPKVFSLRSGAMFETKGTTTDILLVDNAGTPVNTGEVNYVLGYLTIPLMLRATFGNKINFFVEGGPYYASLLSAKLKYTPLPPHTETEANMIDFYNSSDFGISGGVGVSSIFNNLIVPSLEVRNNMGITDIGDDVIEVKTRSLLFLAGVALTIGSRKEAMK